MFPNFNLLNGTTSSLSFLKILNGISKTLGIAREIVPIYKQVEPLVKKMPNFFKKINNIQGNLINFMANNNLSETPEITRIEPIKSTISTPIFFQ